jgi:ABC-type sugar transport system ATPase subunit
MFSVVCGAKRSEVRWSHVNANVRKALEQRVEVEVPASVMIGFRSEHGGFSLGQCSTDFQSVSQRKRIENPCYEVVSFAGTIGLVDRLGNEALVEIRLDEDPTTAQNSQQSDSHITVRSSPELTAEVGQPITVNVATRKLMWFDPKTGENLDRDSKIREKT